jgi:CSLREA domain-containing protein
MEESIFPGRNLMFTEARNSFGARLALILILMIGMLGIYPTQPVLAATLTVTNTNDSGVGSLRQSILNATSGDTITFGASLAGQTIILASDLTINKNLSIDGSGLSPQVTISGGNVAHLTIQNSTLPPTVTISDLTIIYGYTANNGGAISVGGNLTLINSTLRNNYAVGSGGAISGSNLTLKNTTLTQNQSGANGGAILISGNSMSTIINSTITQNQAVSGGGMTIMGNPIVDVFNSTFAHNVASSGDELALIGNGALQLSNTILVCKPGNNGCIIQSGNFSVPSTNSIIGTGALYDFGLAELADNGGPTRTMALSAESLLIDAGDDSVCVNSPVDNLDQRGVSRLQGSHCDIGAYEAIAITVTKSDDTNDGICDTDCSLREAIGVVVGGETINFDPLLAGQTITLNSTLVIDKNLTIDGSLLSTRINISGNNQVTAFGVNPNVTLTLKSLIIKNGKSTVNGGGVSSGGTLIVADSLFTGNNAVVNPYVVGIGEGGAIYSWGVLTITNSVFNGNSASRGGAISCNAGTATVTSSTFVSNSAVSDSGGAIYENCNLTIMSSTFASNSAANSGGAILTDNDINPINITNSTFHGNTAPSGGGVANYGGLIVRNSTFSNNNSPSGGALRNGLGGVLSLRNSILANSVGGVDCIKSDSTPAIENINNLIETTGTAFESCGISLLTSDPLLGPLQDNGGITQTMALLPGSPAINAGDDGNCPSTDQRGVMRPQGGHCDIGAYEYQMKNGSDTTGVFRPSNGLLYLKNSNTSGFADVAINYGLPGDYPVVGDWDGDGDATIGVYRNGTFYLRNSNTLGFADIVFAFGSSGDQPIAGDWDGDGIDTIGVYRPSTGQFLLRNSNTAGSPQMSFYLGNMGDVGIAGDWDGDGVDTTGVFRPSNGVIFLKNINASGFADVALNYGNPGDKPVTGDWNYDGVDTIGIYRNGKFYLRNSNTIGVADLVFALGIPGDMPIAGNWDGIP